MDKITTIRFNSTTMPLSPECTKFRRSCGTTAAYELSGAEVANDYGFRDFIFTYVYSYRIKQHVFFISCYDEQGTEHRMTMQPSHPDFKYLQQFVTDN